MCRINLKDGEIIYDVMQKGNFDMYPSIYPVVASVNISLHILDSDDDYDSYEDYLLNEEDIFNENFIEILDEIYETGVQCD